MRIQPIVRVVDARAGQGRVIVHLKCRHTLSVTDVDLMALPRTIRALGLNGAPRTLDSWPCDLCEDVPAEKSVTQLWKEAGEP